MLSMGTRANTSVDSPAYYYYPASKMGYIFRSGGISSPVNPNMPILSSQHRQRIPLIAPTLELIGIAYSGWFVYRYLLAADNRKELMQQIEILKNYIVGS